MEELGETRPQKDDGPFNNKGNKSETGQLSPIRAPGFLG